MTWNGLQRATAGVTLVTACGGWVSPAAAAEVRGEPERSWQASVQGRWFPGVGEAKGSVAEPGAPDGGAGYALRIERKLSDWWSVGLGLSTSAWSVPTQGATEVLQSGSFVDMVLVLKLEPLSFEIPGGPLSFYVTASGGPTLSGDTQFVTARSSDPEAFEAIQFDAGLAAGASAGMRYQPAPRLSVFLEAGLDWHYAVHGRRSVAFDVIEAAEPFPPVLMERLWVGQGVVAAGVALHF